MERNEDRTTTKSAKVIVDHSWDDDKTEVDIDFVKYLNSFHALETNYSIRGIVYFGGCRALKDAVIQFHINSAVVGGLILASTFSSLFGPLTGGNAMLDDFNVSHAAFAAYCFQFFRYCYFYIYFVHKCYRYYPVRNVWKFSLRRHLVCEQLV